jgi:hypothetical protein
MSVGAAIALGTVIGLALGVVVSVTTDVPFAPEAGLALGALLGWLSRRHRETKDRGYGFRVRGVATGATAPARSDTPPDLRADFRSSRSAAGAG